MLAATEVVSAGTITPEMATVGDPGNSADTTGYGSVASSFRIMKYEFTNAQYTTFLNAVDPSGTNPHWIYHSVWGANDLGTIRFVSGNANGNKYELYANMDDKPVTGVSWFDAARVANWLTNGQGAGDTETGAYTLNGAWLGNAVARNVGAAYYIPTEDEWYKAAYYKGGGTNAGYWDFATQSDSVPTPVGATATGDGTLNNVSPLRTGNTANFNQNATWNHGNADVTTVGTNGGPSAYGAFDMSGNAMEWNDLNGLAGNSSRAIRGGSWYNASSILLSSFRESYATSGSGLGLGFRLASPATSSVPEIDPSSFGSAIAMLLGSLGLVERRSRFRVGRSAAA
jgi:formylglycine-generating enzyme required for sulfatase activity